MVGDADPCASLLSANRATASRSKWSGGGSADAASGWVAGAGRAGSRALSPYRCASSLVGDRGWSGRSDLRFLKKALSEGMFQGPWSWWGVCLCGWWADGLVCRMGIYRRRRPCRHPSMSGVRGCPSVSRPGQDRRDEQQFARSQAPGITPLMPNLKRSRPRRDRRCGEKKV